MKSGAAIALLFLFAATGDAQQDSLGDAFPLALGNRWKYGFNSGSVSSTSHSATTDTGIVEYSITGIDSAADSTRWQFFQVRNFTRSIYGVPYPLFIKDSAGFQIVERKSGRHQLYTPVFDPFSTFPILLTTVDTAKFFRYVPMDAVDTATVRLVYPNDQGSMYSYRCSFLVRKGEGIIQTGGSAFTGFPSNYLWTRSFLQEFSPSYPSPHLLLARTTVNFRTLAGRAQDTSLVIANRGLQPLVITGLSMTGQGFTLLNNPGTIPPLSQEELRIRFFSAAPGTMSSSLVIESTSATSPDTVALHGEAFEAALASLSTNAVNFGTQVAGDVATRTVSLSNDGNIPLAIDSMTWTSNRSEFAVVTVTSPISPEQQGAAVFSFTAPGGDPGGMIDTVSLFTNSTTSPDHVVLLGYHVPRARLTVSDKDIDFSTVEPGHHRDTVVTITNGTDYPTSFSRTDPHEPCFEFVTHIGSGSLDSRAGFSDTIRFSPASRGTFSDTIVYRTYVWGIETGTDTLALRGRTPEVLPSRVELYQNYPNPFNPGTRIRFDIPAQSSVRLKVFDMLGREVATLVNEVLGPGNYEREFSGMGFASGVYVYRLQAGSLSQMRKCLLLK